MPRHSTRPRRLTCLLALALCACSSIEQRPDQVLVRDPDSKDFSGPAFVKYTARLQWEYAVMSENAYYESRVLQGGPAAVAKPASPPSRMNEDSVRSACASDDSALPLTGWRKWDFPSAALRKKMLAEGMYMEVREKSTPPFTVAVIFEGSNFSELADWRANLNLLLRHLPGYKDQYVLAGGPMAEEFHAELARRNGELRFDAASGRLLRYDGSEVRIVAAGHSLGAGLAQFFAYNFRHPASAGPLVADVFAFNPTPVTGWFAAPEADRTASTAGLNIRRIYEHGEVLSYLRLLTNRLGASNKNPAIWEYRYNFESRMNLFGKHSIRRLACGLTIAARPWEGP